MGDPDDDSDDGGDDSTCDDNSDNESADEDENPVGGDDSDPPAGSKTTTTTLGSLKARLAGTQTQQQDNEVRWHCVALRCFRSRPKLFSPISVSPGRRGRHWPGSGF